MNKQPKNRNRIKELRLEQHKTQKDLANYLNVTPQAIAYYEKGLREPPLKYWQKLSDFFNVPPSYLQGLSNDKNGWIDWEKATGYSKERLEKEIKYLVDTGRVNENADLQTKIGHAVKSLDNDSMDSEQGVINEINYKLLDLLDRVYDAFYQKSPKKGIDIRNISSKRDLKSGMTEETLNKIVDILNQARWDIAKIPIHLDGHNPEPYDPDKHNLK